MDRNPNLRRVCQNTVSKSGEEAPRACRAITAGPVTSAVLVEIKSRQRIGMAAYIIAALGREGAVANPQKHGDVRRFQVDRRQVQDAVAIEIHADQTDGIVSDRSVESSVL